MNRLEYNGWTNYETWVVNLWMDNEEGTHDYWLEVGEDVYTNQARENTAIGMTRMDEAVYLLADRLKDYHEDNRPELPGVYCDLLGAALCEVNWREIAKHLLENIEVEA